MTQPIKPTSLRGMGHGGMDYMIERQNETFEARQIELTGHRSDECPQIDHADCVRLAEEDRCNSSAQYHLGHGVPKSQCRGCSTPHDELERLAVLKLNNATGA